MIIFEVDIETCDKSERLLNLVDTHDIKCKKKHNITYVHDPKWMSNKQNVYLIM